MKTLQLESEVTLDYVEQGRRGGIPVVLLHGYTDSRRSFDRVLARLPKSVHAIAVSQRGHGDSERPESGYTPDDFAADLVALMDKLRISQAVIAGHSMGATVALRFAIDHPERTRGLILAGAFFALKGHPGVADLWESTVANLCDPVDAGIVTDFQLSTLAQPIGPTFLDIVVRESLKVPARVWKATLGSLMATDFSQELTKVRAPALLLWGDHDAFVNRSEQNALLTAIPRAVLKVYAGIGHAPHWEEPGRFTDDLVDFISEL